MKSLAWPVSRPGASKSRFLTSSRPGVPIGWTVSDAPSATTSPCSSPSRAVAAAAIRKTISPAWVNRVAILVYWWRSPYRKRVPSSAVASRTRKPFRRRTRRTPSAGTAVHRRPVGQDRVEERLRLVDPDVADAPPQPRRPVERADDDRQDQDDERGAEPRRAEDREDRQPVERVDHRRPRTAGRSGRACPPSPRRSPSPSGTRSRHLPDGHPDDRQQRQEDDLEDGEVDRREEAPQPVPEAGGDVPAGRSGRGRPRDLAARDGRAP